MRKLLNYGYICSCSCIFSAFIMYTVAIIGIDRYVRIKHFANFKALLTIKVVSVFLSIEVLLAFLQAMMKLSGLPCRKEYIVVPVFYTIDG